MSVTEPKSPLTSARMFDKTSDRELADWLENDAQAMDGQPGRNNHVAAIRAAAERLRQVKQPTEEQIEAEYRRRWGHYWWTDYGRAVVIASLLSGQPDAAA